MTNANLIHQASAVTLMESVDPATLVFREHEQGRTDAVRADYPDGDYPALVAIREADGSLLILDGHNRATVAQEDGYMVDVASITRGMYDQLADKYDDLEITYAALCDAEKWDDASGLNNQFAGAGIADNGRQALSYIWDNSN